MLDIAVIVIVIQYVYSLIIFACKRFDKSTI
jgi:hypothetical protein